MAVIVNGFPKTGTHALLKGVHLLGFPVARDPGESGCATHGHFPYPFDKDFPPVRKHICVFRHPRNCLISMCRWQKQPLATGVLISLIRKYEHNMAMASFARQFTPWLTNQSVHIVRYEELITNENILRGVAEYLEVPYLEDAFEYLPGLTRTWMPTHSNWEEYWSDELDKVWQASGMAEVQSRWNY